jgi:hypothetical protein
MTVIFSEKASKGLGVFFWLDRPIDIESKGYTQD